MSNDFATVPSDRENDQLGFAVFLALALHALLIFGFSFALSRPSPAPVALDVTLSQYRSEQAPENAEKLAAEDQLGSGNQDQVTDISSDHTSELPAPQFRDASELTTAVQQRQAGGAQSVITTLGDAPTKLASSHTVEHSPGQNKHNSDAQQQAELASLQAELDRRRREYSRLPRINRLTTASTRSAIEANYMRYWVERIEQTGNLNYPREVRAQGLTGELQLAVVLSPNGDVDRVEVLKSSGHRVLDQAAIRIVRQASPFAPFTDELRQWDKIEIIRTWKFLSGDKLTTESVGE